LLQDIAMAILGCCADIEKKAIDWNLAKALVEAYDIERPMNAFEKKHLRQFFSFSALVIATWRFRSELKFLLSNFGCLIAR
jgi:Ser/Thr protein kinase RdoA (MazF antagonist)